MNNKKIESLDDLRFEVKGPINPLDNGRGIVVARDDNTLRMYLEGNAFLRSEGWFHTALDDENSEGIQRTFSDDPTRLCKSCSSILLPITILEVAC